MYLYYIYIFSHFLKKNPHDLSWRIVFYVVNPRAFVSSSELFAKLVCGFFCKTRNYEIIHIL